MGDPNVRTPNIDRLHVEGVSCRGVAGFPLCCPYRGALLSGRYPHLVVPGHEYRLPPEQPTVAHAFRAAGYHTAYIGKWHLDGYHEREGRAAYHIIPPERRGGFDHWIGYENNNSQFDCWVHGPRRLLEHQPGADRGRLADDGQTWHYRLPGYETDSLTDLLIHYLRQRGDAARLPQAGPPAAPTEAAPFFAVLSVQPPHDPFMAPEAWMGRHNAASVELRGNVPPIAAVQARARRNLAGYYAMVENLDWNLGRIRQALHDTGLWENTYIVFFSDHGEMAGSHGQFAKMTPYEEATRVPMVMGGGIPFYDCRRDFTPDAGAANALINHVDMAPTALGLAGIDKPDWMQGMDYSGLLRRDRPVPTPAESAYLQLVIPTGHGNSNDRPWRGVITRDGWKYVTFQHNPFMLFNLNDDPYELANCAFNPAYHPIRRRLHAQTRQWAADVNDPFAFAED